MEVETEISNLKMEIVHLKKVIDILKSVDTKIITDLEKITYKYSELDNERLKIIVENQKIKAEMKQVTQPANEEDINIQ